ncbi:Elongator complex protein 4 [Psilocybe cubensis]|uniref:Elongator complex protein 4 n=1 Tax=Psilocybe cubensis TaxID=181762 RepID=A0ACB8HGB2_PSICU|nr:Elongator complex protein 4 [Psilocybe cubensis]KAH9486750.1 Elongator complex protein 4 [Psilocybe cubensis]
MTSLSCELFEQTQDIEGMEVGTRTLERSHRHKMSSFKRKATGKQTLTVYPGTRISPASNLSLITSTGISSLDDILGGGLPLTCSLVFGAPDIHSSYGDLIQKYFVAQGLGNGHRVCVVGEDAEKFVRDIMWFPKAQELQRAAESDDDDKPANQDEKVKIAWRYEKMKQFQTTVGSQDGDCLPFELASRVPKEMIDDGLKSQRIRVVNAGTNMFDILGEISRFLEAETKEATRICIAGLGSAGWGDVSPQVCERIVKRETGLTDRNAANPGLASIFPSHHGLVSVQRVPSPQTQSAPSERFSTLRGLGSSGENNLGFKCTRKRLVFETVHLDIEGGTGERRTKESNEGARKVKTSRKKVVFENDF